MMGKRKIIFVLLLIITILITYVFSYINWRKKTIHILTQSEHFGDDKKQNERPKFFYFSINDQKTFLGHLFIPAIWIDLYISKLEYVCE